MNNALLNSLMITQISAQNYINSPTTLAYTQPCGWEGVSQGTQGQAGLQLGGLGSIGLRWLHRAPLVPPGSAGSIRLHRALLGSVGSIGLRCDPLALSGSVGSVGLCVSPGSLQGETNPAGHTLRWVQQAPWWDSLTFSAMQGRCWGTFVTQGTSWNLDTSFSPAIHDSFNGNPRWTALHPAGAVGIFT